jgi:ribonuclease BN (tRNA processing enzyme)
VFATSSTACPVLRVIVTHMHPDHIGLAHWLCERWSTPEHECRLWISAADYQTARYACEVVNSFGGERLAEYFRSHGMTDPDDLEQIRHRKSYYRNLVPAVPPSYARLIDRPAADHRRPGLALHRRLGPRARAHGAALRGSWAS